MKLFFFHAREYRVAGNRYSRFLFTSEDRLCANLRMQEQLLWRHMAKSEKPVLGENGEMSNRWLF